MNKSHRTTEVVGKDLKELFIRGVDLEEFNEVTRLISEFHAIPGDGKKKLDDKDQQFVTLYSVLERMVILAGRAGHINKIQLLLFLAIVGIFQQLESILWELKGHTSKEPLPKPDPLPPLPPDEPNDDDDDGRERHF
jgi:hypothetical protein